MIGLPDVEAARARISGQIRVSPCEKSERLSKLTGAEVWLKLENTHLTGSFKERGALNKLLTLPEADRNKGVVAASAGNHAQGVAYNAGRLGLKATIVMPEGTPLVKVSNTRGYGARVVLHGANFDEAYAEARRIEQAEQLAFVHPFDDDAVIAGQGTIALELAEQVPDLDAVVVPVGGGGLIGGVAVGLKAKLPGARVYGVETEAFPCMKRSLEQGKVTSVEPGSTLADGIAVKKPGERTFELAQKLVDGVVTVGEEDIASAILWLLEREKTVVEGAGAVPLAALLGKRLDLAGRKVALVISGGNIDVNLVARVIERGLVRDGRMVRLTVSIPDKPGALAKLTALIAESRANVIEVYHLRAFGAHRFGDTDVELTLETRGPEHVEELMAALRARGYLVRDESAA